MTGTRSLSRRERQVMDAVFQLGRASVADVRAHLEDPPSYDSVRTTLRILESKGHLNHTQDASRYIYAPVKPQSDAAREALRRLVRVFFDGSPKAAAMSLLNMPEAGFSESDLARLADVVAEAGGGDDGDD